MKLLLSGLALSLSAPTEDRTQHIAHLSFNASLQLISSIFIDLENYLNISMAQ